MKCTIVDNQPAIVFSGVTHIVTVEDMARIRMESGDVLLMLAANGRENICKFCDGTGSRFFHKDIWRCTACQGTGKTI